MTHEFPGFQAIQTLHASPRSSVHRAIRAADGATVIVKQPADDVIAAEGVRRIQDEYDMLRAVRGPGVADALAVLRDGRRAALVVEDVGDVLSRWIAERRFSIREALDIAIEIARGLARIHALGVVHKDVNPNNLAYDPDTRAVTLIDFDLAFRLDHSALVSHSVGEGTLHYLAPEQTGRLNRPVDARSDLYSLGATLYELFTGRRPFLGDEALALVHAHLAEEAPRIDAIDPRIPRVVGDIVSKLMAKAPERRYQTAAGATADLERCRQSLIDDGAVAGFAIGLRDAAPRFELPDRLYGRDAEVLVLLDAFARVAQGASETVLVSGQSGVGKSALVREIDRRLAGQGGYFAWGKFEQLNRDVPYSAIARVVDGLIAQVLAGETIERSRADIAAAVGDAGALVRTVVPSIERVLGEQPPVAALDPDVARRRLGQAMARLVQVFARKPHPLVMFLDDLQWADAASLQLLTELATSDDTEALLVIDAFRDNEVDDAHPMAEAVRVLERRRAPISRIALLPLTLDEATELVADALRQPVAAVAAAAAVIWRKTEGSPFFVRRFLHALHGEGFVAFDPEANAFTLDGAAVDRAAITENVADLLAHQLSRLPDATRSALVAAAALGSQFETATLAGVLAVSAGELRGTLAPAVDAGMIAQAELEYGFQHDRIQQAAYEAAPRELRERLHLTIGRRLLAEASPGELDERLFRIVHHLGRGAAWLDAEPDRARFVELASEAARRASRAGAFDVAASLLGSVCAVRGWDDHHDAAFAAHVALADALSLGGSLDAARDIVRIATEHAAPREQAALAILETRISSRFDLMVDVLAHGRRAAALLGIELPTDPAELGRQLGAEMAAVMAAIAERPIEQWIDLPVMTEPDKLAAMALLYHCIPAAYQKEPALHALLCVKLATLSLRHGNCAESAYGYAAFAITFWIMGNYDLTLRLGKLGFDLSHRFDAAGVGLAVEVLYAACVMPWRYPIADCVAYIDQVAARANDGGDPLNLAYIAIFSILYRGVLGNSLVELLSEARRARRLCARLGFDGMHITAGWHVYHARWWTGSPAEETEVDVDFAAAERELQATPGMHMQLMALQMGELERRYWSGDAAGAAAIARSIAPLLVSLPSNSYNAEHRMYACLTALAVDGPEADVAASRADLVRYAEFCPVNYRPMLALVDAEQARGSGDIAAALAMYDAAIEGAAAQGFVKLEVLGHEHAARFWIGRGKPAFAAVHLAKARDLCQHWGALPRARELELSRRRLGATHDALTRTLTSSAFASTLDFAAVLKASQAIASDMVLDSLLGKMMEIIVENAGAQAGSIALASSGALSIHASKQPGAQVWVSGGVPLEAARDVSEGIVKYVMRTMEFVVLGDATRHPVFRSDPYVHERRPRSVLCLPIVHKDQAIGAVYLENNLVADAFTVERLDALGILMGQLAISIENAMMFSQLEELVARRTQALTEANRQLREQSLVRERMESELRLAQKLQSVGQLAAGVAHEINTPMQYIADNLSFLDDALGSLFAVIADYRQAIDPATGAATGRSDAAALDHADREHDLDYLRKNVPLAFVQARDGVARVSRIVRAMREFSHPDRWEQTPTSLRAALENTLVVAHNAYRDVAEVVTDFAELPDVMCHPGEINQVFLNLLVNAAHAIEDVVKAGGRRGTITVRTWQPNADTAMVAIADTGSGIPEAIRDRVFDPFFTTKEIGRGTGQGLALARAAIVDRHGGTIDFETQPGKGTTFYVRMPIRGRAAISA